MICILYAFDFQTMDYKTIAYITFSTVIADSCVGKFRTIIVSGMDLSQFLDVAIKVECLPSLVRLLHTAH